MAAILPPAMSPALQRELVQELGDLCGVAAVMDQPQVIVGKGGHGKYR